MWKLTLCDGFPVTAVHAQHHATPELVQEQHTQIPAVPWISSKSLCVQTKNTVRDWTTAAYSQRPPKTQFKLCQPASERMAGVTARGLTIGWRRKVQFSRG